MIEGKNEVKLLQTILWRKLYVNGAWKDRVINRGWIEVKRKV